MMFSRHIARYQAGIQFENLSALLQSRAAGGGIHKRLDENRELLEYLKDNHKEVLMKSPWIVGWIRANDEFFQLAKQLLGNGDVGLGSVRLPRPFPEIFEKTKSSRLNGPDAFFYESANSLRKKLGPDINIGDYTFAELQEMAGAPFVSMSTNTFNFVLACLVSDEKLLANKALS